MGVLAEVIANSGYQSLDRFSVASGIPLFALQDWDDGDTQPDEEYLLVLRSMLPGFRESVISNVADELKGKKSLPSGYSLISIPAGDIVPGDFYPYLTKSGQTLWCAVTEVDSTSRKSLVWITVFGGNHASVTRSRVVRVARRLQAVE